MKRFIRRAGLRATAIACTLMACVATTVRAAPLTLHAFADGIASGAAVATQQAEAQRQLDTVTRTAPLDDRAAFADAFLVPTAARWLGELPADQTMEAAALVRDHPQTARELLLVLDEHDDLPAVFALWKESVRTLGDRADTFPGLVAAICVVFDQPFTVRVNENEGRPDAPLAILDYFVRHEKRMALGLRAMPAELMVYVVDAGAAVGELEWALDAYGGKGPQRVDPGQRFFDIDYDHQHFLRGTPKKVTTAGFSLPNIRRYGGVCADQAHFAVTVAKANGIPAMYTRGRSAESSHAWVGFLEAASRTRLRFNFDAGRYDAYQAVRGYVLDPTRPGRNLLSDADIGLLAESMAVALDDRLAALGMVEAARHLATRGTPTSATGFPAARDGSPAARLELMRAALDVSSGAWPAWMELTRMAQAGELSPAQVRGLADAAVKLYAQRYPDFMIAVLRVVIATVDDADQQAVLWDRTFAAVGPRNDLAAEVRFEQGKLWEVAGEPVKAGRAYEDVIRRFAMVSPYVVDALAKTEAMLIQAGRPEKVVGLYADTFRRLAPPRSNRPEFANQSNYVRVGRALAQRLREAGLATDAHRVDEAIRQQLAG